MISRHRRYLPVLGFHRLPLGYELAIVIVLKVIALIAIYYLFFSPAHRPVTDTLTHLLGNTVADGQQPITGSE